MTGRLTLGAIVVVFVIGIGCLLASMTTVDPGHEALLIGFGGKVNYNRTLPSGFHFVWPWEDVEQRDIRVQKEEVKAKAFSIDMQEDDIVVAVNYRPIPNKINRLYNEYGDTWLQRVVVPSIHESIKAGTAQYTAEDIIAQRAVVKGAVEADLGPRLERGFIELVELNIVDFDFKKEFKDAVELKQIMAQQALEEKNKKEKEKWIADQEIEKVRGEAARISQKAAAISENPQILALNAIEAWQAGGSQVPQILILGGGDSASLVGIIKAAFAPLDETLNEEN